MAEVKHQVQIYWGNRDHGEQGEHQEQEVRLLTPHHCLLISQTGKHCQSFAEINDENRAGERELFYKRDVGSSELPEAGPNN